MSDRLPSTHFNELARLETWYWWHQTRFEIGKRWLALEPGEHFADVGCGMGGFLQFMHDSGLPAGTGIDASPSALAAIRAKGFEAYNLELAESGSIPGAPWDALSCMDVMEHIEDDKAFLNRIHASLSLGGKLFLTVPSDPRLYSDWDRQLGHFRRYRIRELSELLERSGFEVKLKSHIFGWAWLPGLLRARRPSANLDFPPVSRLLNRILGFASRLEFKIGERLPTPLGTSIAILARSR